MKFISTGGLGDSWIVYLKLVDEFGLKFSHEWLHVESNDNIKKMCEDLYGKHNFKFECDPNYIQDYLAGKWKDYEPISSGVDAFCPLKGKTKYELEHPFLLSGKEINYDVCLQVSAGAKNSRNWSFDPRGLAQLLRKQGRMVCLIGSDKKYEDENDKDNFVGKTDILAATNLVRASDVFVGLSGFLNYYACSHMIKNIHVIESEEHEKRYYHPLWKRYSMGIEYPSLISIKKALSI